MKHFKILFCLLASVLFSVALSSCSDDDDDVQASISLSSDGAVLPAEASVSAASVKVNGRGGTLSIPLVCSSTNDTYDATYTVSSSAGWCKASVDGSTLILNIAKTSLREGRTATVLVNGQASGATIRPLAVTVLQGNMKVPVVVLSVNTDSLNLPTGDDFIGVTLSLKDSAQQISLPINVENPDDAELDYTLTGPADTTWLKASYVDGNIVLNASRNLSTVQRAASISLSVKQTNGEQLTANTLSLQVTQQPFVSSVDMVLVDGGTFKFGGVPAEEQYPNSYTYAFDAEVDPFYIGKTEVTQKLYSEIMGTTVSRGDNYPIEKVSWVDAVEFCNKLSIKDGLTPAYKANGKVTISDPWGFFPDEEYTLYELIPGANGYRLPTSAEWEFAAKGGNEGVKNLTLYPGGNNIDELAWDENNSDYKAHPVAGKKPNGLGIYDMAGNVGEWCNDWETKKTDYPKTLTKNYLGPDYAEGFEDKVFRGGYYSSVVSDCKCYYIKSHSYGDATNGIGFRVVRNAK